MVDQVKEIALPQWVGLNQSVEGLNRTKGLGKNSLCLAFSWDICLLSPAFRLELGTHSISSFAS